MEEKRKAPKYMKRYKEQNKTGARFSIAYYCPECGEPLGIAADRCRNCGQFISWGFSNGDHFEKEEGDT